MPAEFQKVYDGMIARFKEVYPHFERPFTPEESVTAVLNLVDTYTVKDTGIFVSHKGNREWM